MSKWIILSLFVFSTTLYAPSDAYARRSGSHGHSHGRSSRLSFNFPLPSYKSHSRPADPTPSFTHPIYQYRERPLPRIYTLNKPLIDDAGIYRLLTFSKQKYYRPDFYRYDEKRDQYFAPRLLHADAGVVLTRRAMPIEVNGQIFYYNEGLFFRESGKHFVVVPPVINSIVKTIPKRRADVDITGHYEYNGIYFRKVPQGYQVVGSPTIK